MKRQPIGVDDFKHIVDNDLFFVDKTLFIKDIIDNGSQVILITRPRRFGKTLNMSLLRYFFEITDSDTSYLFKEYRIWAQGEEYKQEQGKYPVINITFKGIKTNSWETNFDLIKKNIKSEFQKHDYLLASDALSVSEKKDIETILMDEGGISDYIKSLEILSKFLYIHHGQKTIILLDEYDTFLNEAYIHEHWEKAIDFMKAFMNAGFKNNQYLYKGIMTGIFRVARESIFSDMNNLNVCSILSDHFRDDFGFAQEEVEDVLKYYGIAEDIDKVAQWYNGYMFGKKNRSVIYNPWSIIMYANKGILEPYWINTSGNDIIKKLATEGTREIQLNMQKIIEGGTLENIKVDENIIYSQITISENSIWSFLLMSGYLTAIKVHLQEDGVYCALKAPNKEVFFFFRNMMESWLNETVKGGSTAEMLNSLIIGDIDTFNEIFSRTATNVLSYHDVGEDKAESFYHAFVLGMLVHLDKEYEIRSNRESGYGRYDVMIIPKDKSKKGVVIEFKKASELKGESLDEALSSALRQIDDRKYDAELRATGISHVVKLGIAFKGKLVKMGASN